VWETAYLGPIDTWVPTACIVSAYILQQSCVQLLQAKKDKAHLGLNAACCCTYGGYPALVEPGHLLSTIDTAPNLKD